jgi:methyl-accepting chemotaxis protein
MQLSIRNKLVLLCVVPVLLLVCLITALSVILLRNTAEEQVRDTRKMLISERELAIEYSVEVAQSVIVSIYPQSAPGDMAARDRGVVFFKQLHYGKDGYYFGYDADSVKVFWADKEQQVGDSFKSLRDPMVFTLSTNSCESRKTIVTT